MVGGGGGGGGGGSDGGRRNNSGRVGSSAGGISAKSAGRKMPIAPYELRAGEIKNKKHSMAELKLRRLTELNVRLKEDLERRRIPVSDAANDLISFTEKEPKDFMVPSKWGTVDKRDDPYAPQKTAGCCNVM